MRGLLLPPPAAVDALGLTMVGRQTVTRLVALDEARCRACAVYTGPHRLRHSSRNTARRSVALRVGKTSALVASSKSGSSERHTSSRDASHSD